MKEDTEKDKHIDVVNVESFKYNSIRLVIVTKLDINSNQRMVKNTCKIDEGSDSNLMSYNVLKILSLRQK